MAEKLVYAHYDLFALARTGAVRITIGTSNHVAQILVDEYVTIEGLTIKVRQLESWEINPRLGASYELTIKYNDRLYKSHVFGTSDELERIINLEICRSKNLTDAQTYDIVGRQGIEATLIDEYYVMGQLVALYQFKDNSGYYLDTDDWSTSSFQYEMIPKSKDVLELIGKYAFWKVRRRRVKK
jgi:hypothetical protein